MHITAQSYVYAHTHTTRDHINNRNESFLFEMCVCMRASRCVGVLCFRLTFVIRMRSILPTICCVFDLCLECVMCIR